MEARREAPPAGIRNPPSTTEGRWRPSGADAEGDDSCNATFAVTHLRVADDRTEDLDEDSKEGAAVASVKVIEEIGLVYRILRERIDDESFVQWVTNEVTGLALPVREGSVVSISDNMDTSGVHILIDILRRHVSNEFVQRDILRSIGDLAYQRDDDFCVAVGRQGGIGLVTQAMVRFPNNESLQKYGCLALGNLSITDEIRAGIAGQGGIELVIRSMSKFPNHEQLQHFGCLALGNFSVMDENSVAVVRQGGIELIVKAMEQCPNHELVQQFACWAILALAFRDADCVTIASHRGVDRVVEAMARFPTNEKLQEFCCLALGNLSNRNDAICASIIEKGGLELAISAMERFTSNEKTQSGGCCLFANLASNDLGQKAKTFLDLVVEAMKRFPTSNGVLRLGSNALEAGGSLSFECRAHVEALDGTKLARRAWNDVLSREDKVQLKADVLLLSNRFIFDDNFLSEHAIT